MFGQNTCACFPHLTAFFFFLMLSGIIWSQFWNVKARAVLQERTRCPGVFSSQGLRSLQLECFWYWLCSLSDCVGDSASVPGLLLLAGGLFPTTHVAAIKRRKGPCSREQCYCLLEIPRSRCHSLWIHFHHGEQRKKEGGSLPTKKIRWKSLKN